MAEDDDAAGKDEGNQGKGYQEEGAETALPEGPAIDWEIVGAADALHEGRQDAGGTDEADQQGDEKSTRGAGAVRRLDEIALQ